MNIRRIAVTILFLSTGLLTLLVFVNSVRGAENTAAGRYQGASPSWVGRMPQAATARQMVVVAYTGGTNAVVSMHEKCADGKWYQIISTPGLIGRNGLGKTREGDNKTPVGTFHFNAAFGILDDPGCAFTYHKLTSYDYWSGDNDRYYNRLVDIRNVPGLNTANSEHPIDTAPFYNYCLNISYNEEGVAGKGSGIFLHCFGGRSYTHGCVAVEESQMKRIMNTVQTDCIIVIDSAQSILAH